MALNLEEESYIQPYFKLITIDSGLLLVEKSRDRIIRTFNNLSYGSVAFLIHSNDQQEHSASEEMVKHLKITSYQFLNTKDRASQSKSILSLATGKSRPSLPEKISAGKQILHLGERRSAYIDIFEPPKGIACHKFYKVVWGTECPFDCAYCFLQLTFRMVPYIRQYLNLEKLFIELDKLDSLGKQILLNSGELCDSLAVDHITQIAPEVIEAVNERKNIELLLLTKSSNIGHLPQVNNGKVILAASITTPHNAKIFEKNTADPYERIHALVKAKDKGYRIRCRIDPIITHSNAWELEYERIIKYLFDAISPEIITIGQPRFYPMLIQFIKKRNYEAGLYFENCAGVLSGERQRTKFNNRAEVYKKVAKIVEKYGGTVPIAPCKEEPEMLKTLGMNLRTCNCII